MIIPKKLFLILIVLVMPAFAVEESCYSSPELKKFYEALDASAQHLKDK
jgi:hypothetical protein